MPPHQLVKPVSMGFGQNLHSGDKTLLPHATTSVIIKNGRFIDPIILPTLILEVKVKKD